MSTKKQRRHQARRKQWEKEARRKFFVWGGLLLVVFVIGYFAISSNDRGQAPSSRTAPEIGAVAPDFTLSDIDGNQFALSDFRGKPIAIMFFHSW